jgi:hypothetical protein
VPHLATLLVWPVDLPSGVGAIEKVNQRSSRRVPNGSRSPETSRVVFWLDEGARAAPLAHDAQAHGLAIDPQQLQVLRGLEGFWAFAD